LSGLFKWAVDNGKASIDPFAKLKVHIGAKAGVVKKTLPYTFGELQRVFAALDPAQDERHWAILIALYTGCRANEVAQLYVDDVQNEDGIPYLHIREGRPDQKVKGHRAEKRPCARLRLDYFVQHTYLPSFSTQRRSSILNDATC